MFFVTTSKTSINNKETYLFKDGRRYHSQRDVAYVLPNDEDEGKRMELQHRAFKLILDDNFKAPVIDKLKEGITVLDSGCGPASWTFDMAETYPNSTFYVVDISKVFPIDKKPVNVDFETANIAKHIPFPDNTFDSIHQRLLVPGLTNEDWNANLKELYRVLKPRGYIELAELNFQDYEDMGPLFTNLKHTLSDILLTKGLVPTIGSELNDRLKKVGFTNVKTEKSLLNVNHTNPVGDLIWWDFKHVYLNSHPALSKFHPEWEDMQVYKAYVEKCGEEAKEYKTNSPFFSNYAQKPSLN